MAVAALLAACGGGDSTSGATEAEGTYEVKVTAADFPTRQFLGQTSLLRIGVRNTGEETVPNLIVTVGIAGKEGNTSSLPFGIHDPTPGLAQADRPVWVLASSYPRLADSSDPGGSTTSNSKSFAFGKLKPGETTEAVWKLSAVRAGKWTLLYRVNAGLGGASKAETTKGVAAGGTFIAEITREPPETEVTDSGDVVEITRSPQTNGQAGE